MVQQSQTVVSTPCGDAHTTTTITVQQPRDDAGTRRVGERVLRGAARVALTQCLEPRRGRAVVEVAARLAKEGTAAEDAPAALVLVAASTVVDSTSGGSVSLVSLAAVSLAAVALGRRDAAAVAATAAAAAAAAAAAVALVVPPLRVRLLAHKRGGGFARRRELRVERLPLALELNDARPKSEAKEIVRAAASNNKSSMLRNVAKDTLRNRTIS